MTISNKTKGNNWEKQVQKSIASGMLWFDKGDLRTSDYLIECKFTDKKGFRITDKIIRKIWEESLNANKLPAIVVGIMDQIDKDNVWMLDIKIHKEKR